MKTNKLFVMGIAAIAVAACAPKVSETTTISGVFAGEAPAEVHVTLPGQKIDFKVPVTDGKFTAELPTTKTEYARIEANNMTVELVPDGTPLTINFTADNHADLVSKYPELSVNERSKAFQNAQKDMDNAVSTLLDSLQKAGADDSMIEKVYADYGKNAKALFLKTIGDNKDNVISAKALNRIQSILSVAQLDSILATLAPEVLSLDPVAAIKGRIEKGKQTAEGKMFTDFEVNGQKLSDFVGKGKYMLVDFWASWCGPCKGEIPNLKQVYDKYHGDQFDILSVAVWDEPQASLDTAKAYGVKWNHMVGAQKVPTDLYGIEGIPHIILFGPDGTILKRDLRGEAIEAEVAKFVQPVK